MSFLPWKAEYSVGVTHFDNQHKRMFEFINELGRAVNEIEEEAVLNEILERLVNYTEVHFRDEETNMARYNFPGFTKHKDEHEALTRRVCTYHQNFKSGKISAPDVMTFLQNWILGHILQTDMDYRSLLHYKEIITG